MLRRRPSVSARHSAKTPGADANRSDRRGILAIADALRDGLLSRAENAKRLRRDVVESDGSERLPTDRRQTSGCLFFLHCIAIWQLHEGSCKIFADSAGE